MLKNRTIMATPIYPCLWYDGNAAEAAAFYCRVFPNSKLLESNSLVVTFDLNGRKFMGLNGGPLFKFNESVSFVVECADQTEIDYYWQQLTADGGQESMCGWLKDKYGMSWQIVPAVLPRLLENREKAEKVMAALMKMKKLDIAGLEQAAAS